MIRFFLALICLMHFFNSQSQTTLSGYVKDEQTGETLIGAIVYNLSTNDGAVTNEYGFYSLPIKNGEQTIAFKYVGFQEKKHPIIINGNTTLNMELSANSYEVDAVEIILNEEQQKIENAEMSVAKLSAETIKKIPAVMGEVDLIKSIQLLPGVTNNGEGATGFNVRGGATDQNLVMLDEAIIYNSDHMLGFFSVFNNDAIKDVKLYKGGIPARFGGRASSVLDVRQKDGNNKTFGASGGLGLISSRLLLEGPLKKDKASFLVAGRSSYAHLFLKLTDNDNSLRFYDLNLKANYQLNENNQLFLSGYFGSDDFILGNFFKNNYGNATANLRWNHIYNNRLFSNLSLIYSHYTYGLDFTTLKFKWLSGIDNLNTKYDFKYYMNQTTSLDFGANLISYNFNPGEVKPTSTESSLSYEQLQQKRALEGALYISANQDFGKKFTAEYGIRYSNFYRLGGQQLNHYNNNQPVAYDEDLEIYSSVKPQTTVSFKKNDVIKDFHNFEPRIALSYRANENTAFKLSYNKIAQYIHLISNSQTPTPLDVWAPSGKFIQPQIANQYAFGLFKNAKEKNYSIELEGFYKTIENRIDYIDGADLIANDAIEQVILPGESKAYGSEFLLKKNEGNLTGWLAYTLSKSMQKTDGGSIGGLGINNGDWYSTNHDKTHDLSITGNYNLNKTWNFGANFALQSGRPVTYPNAQYMIDGISVANFAERNANRLPVYHRFDLSATLTPKKNEKKRLKREWIFSIYNLYNRKNANSIRFTQNPETGNNQAERLSIFGIIPSATWNFKF